MKKLFLISALTLLMFSSSVGAEVCEGPNEMTVDINGEFGFCWDQNSEPDVAKYTIYKDDLVYDTVLPSACDGEACFSPRYTENVPGEYTFSVTASDANFESDKSDPVKLFVLDLPPSKPSGCSIRIF